MRSSWTTTKTSARYWPRKSPSLATKFSSCQTSTVVTLAAVLRGTVEHVELRVIGISGVEHLTLDAASERGIFDMRALAPPAMR